MTSKKFRCPDFWQSWIRRSGSGQLIAFLIGLASAGCGGSGAELVEAPKLDHPESFADTEKTWTLKSDMETTDEEALTQFFQSHSTFQGSTDFEGPPTMYISGTTDRRFYWLRGTTVEPVWSCVHFEDGDFQITEGSGNPFSK